MSDQKYPNFSRHTQPIILGLLGKAGSGKTTAAQHLSDVYGARRVSFAAPLKEMAKVIWEFTDEQVYGSTESKETWDDRWNLTPRTAMQRLGASARDCIDSQIWVHAAIRAIVDHRIQHPEQKLYVIDDMRYVNEVEGIREVGGFQAMIVRLTCTDASSSADGTHSSEAEMDQLEERKIDAHVVSHRTPGSAHLKSCMDDLMERFVIPRLRETR